MPKHLVIVESPAKARTIERYLGEEFHVLASFGHVRDLPENPGKGKLGVDVDNGFAPDYVIPDERRKQVAAIEKAARSAIDVYLATDLDREGEAIAWHVAEAANVPLAKTRRVTFSEITRDAILEAFTHPREIDRNLVDAQQARRIVDRIVGYTLSPLISRKVRPGLSAGRVQSVAVRLVVEREREIRAFVAREYWSLEATLATPDGTNFGAEVVRIGGKAVEIADGETAARHAAAIRALRPVVASVATRSSKRNPPPPFTTSTLQQEASRKLGFSPKRTMSVAQRLYEGVDTPDGHIGLITYMRTDSTAIAGVAMAEAQRVVTERFGERYGTGRGRVYKTRAKGAQEAHESIRPTSFGRDPDSLRSHLKAEELKLYRLIWQRALASQMASKELETTTAELEAGDYRLRASATRTLFDGYTRVYTEGRDDGDEEAERTLPPLQAGDTTEVVAVTPTQHFTEPPPRYTEASLVKALEEHGIGRPSTYASTMSTIIERGYVRVIERRLHPELAACFVTDYLVSAFAEYVDPGFTAAMEEDLDEIASGERAWVPLLQEFYPPLKETVEAHRHDPPVTLPTDEVCSLGHPVVLRLGRNGPFLSCATFPDHKESRPVPAGFRLDGSCGMLDEPAPVGDVPQSAPCPVCGEGVLTPKRGPYGPFLGCSRYPECRYIHKDGPPPPDQLPFEVTCPVRADGTLRARRARRTGNVFWGCTAYPACDFTTNDPPTGAVHDAHDDGRGAVARRGDAGLCLTCGAPVALPDGDLVGQRLAGGEPDPAALERPARRGGRRGGPRPATGARGASRSSAGRRSGAGSRRTRA
jgi:DNA topoisomerase-1